MNNEFNILYKVFHFNQRSGILSIQNIGQNQKLIIIFFPKWRFDIRIKIVPINYYM